MKIVSAGFITPMGNDSEVIWERFNKNIIQQSNKNDFESCLSKKDKRKINRFADLATTATVNCYTEAQNSIDLTDKNKSGCIFTTSYGPLETNMEFAKQVIADDPDACSPILFSNTVHNACLGTLSIRLGITGPSTMLMGSNQFMLTDMLLKEEKADFLMAGCLDEYNDELAASLIYQSGREQNLKEACVVFGLVQDAKYTEGITIKNINTINLGCNPYEDMETENYAYLQSKLMDLGADTDVVITNDSKTEIGKFEKEVLTSNFPSSCIIDQAQDYFGNCLGADLGLKVLLSKLLIEKNDIPKALLSQSLKPEQVNSITICSFDLTGNYTIMRLER